MPNNETILLVDDDQKDRELISMMLADNGYNMAIASSGRECMSMIETELPDLVIIDIMTPGMSGYELCALLRYDPITESTPIFFLSAMATEDQMAYPHEDEPNEYLTKPIDHANLLKKVQTTLLTRSLLHARTINQGF